MPKLRRIPFELVLILIALMTHAYVVFSPANSLVNWFTTDDAYYYFKVAQNMAEGHGSTFDRIGLTNGYHPLWMLVCVPIFFLARYDLILPMRVVVGVLAILNAATAVLLYRLLKRYLSDEASALAALFWMIFPNIHGSTTTLGMESGLNAFFLVLLISLAARFERSLLPAFDRRRQVWLMGFVAALALLSRLDNIFFLIVLGLWMLFRSRLTRFLVFGDFLTILVGVFGSYYLRLPLNLYYYYSESAMAMMALALVLKPILYYLLGLYRPVWPAARFGQYLRALLGGLAGSLVVAGLMMGLNLAGVLPRFPRAVLLIDLVLSPLLALAVRLASRKVGVDDELLDSSSPLERFSWAAWKRWLPGAVAYYTPLLGTLAAYMVTNLLIIGTPMPVSGQIKRWWGTIYTVYGKPAMNPIEILGLNADPSRSPWTLFTMIPYRLADLAKRIFGFTSEEAYGYWLLAAWALVLVIVGALLRSNKKFTWRVLGGLATLPLFMGCVLQIVSYKMTGYVSLHSWYWIAEMVLVTLLFALLLDLLIVWLGSRKVSPSVVRAGVLLLGAGLLVNFVVMLGMLVPWNVAPENAEGYLAGARGLEESTNPGDIIGSTGGGTLAYFVRGRTIVNLDGLISSYEYFNMLKSGRGREYVDRIGLNYVYGGDYVLRFSEPYNLVFEGQLKYLKTIVGSDLFRYYPGGWP